MVSWLEEPLQTKRLRLRPTRPGDEEWIIQLFTDPEVRKYVGGAMSEETAREAVQLRGELWGHFAIMYCENEEVIGSLSFTRKSDRWEINYELRRNSWGQGLAAEAIVAALQWFFDETDEDEVSAVTQTANIRSCRLLDRLGAHQAGTFMYRNVVPVYRYVFNRVNAK